MPLIPSIIPSQTTFKWAGADASLATARDSGRIIRPMINAKIADIIGRNTPNHALQRTPGFGVQLPSAACVRPAQSRAVRPAMKPGTARAFASRRRAHSRVPGPESLSLGSFGGKGHCATKCGAT